MPSRASAVAVVISLRRRFASLMVSTPLSEKMPCWAACVVIAMNCSAVSPASRKYAGYSLRVSKNSPFAFAPATSPCWTRFSDCWMSIPNCFDTALAATITSRKSESNVSASTVTWFRTCESS